MRLIKFLTFFLFLLSSEISMAQWTTDTLGGNFQKMQINQGTDYSGPIISTVVRLLSPDSSTHKSVLYIHGFNDYFFQKELAEQFVEHQYDFYAVDLRKYGRSTLEGQKQFQVRNLNEYFPDIDSALNLIKLTRADTIVLMGHSTGGLISAYYMHQNPDAPISALVLNSPFLDWNLGKLECLVPLISAMGKIFPNLKIPQSGSVYGSSLDVGAHGEWTFNKNWKHVDSSPVDAGWVRAINLAQNLLKKQPYEISIPILLLYSDKSFNGKEWTEEAQSSDAVLDVSDIERIGLTLGHDVTPHVVDDGMHDLFLSSPSVRYPLYKFLFDWLATH